MTKPRRPALLFASLLFAAALHARRVEAQVDQSALAAQILRGGAAERTRAVEAARTLGPQKIGQELRVALITALEREGQVEALRYAADDRGEKLEPRENPEFIFQVAGVVAELRDPEAIPALVGALGTGSGSPVIRALVDFGEQAVPALLTAVTAPETRHYVVDDALLVLRFLVEGAGPRPLTLAARDRIVPAAIQRLNARQPGIGTTLRRAIDLAVILGDPELRRIVQAIASDRNELIARGLTDPEMIDATQKRAVDRLAGIPPNPRWR